jgi:ATP-dependent exoDNAse (exonuclease V) alpha subunit
LVGDPFQLPPVNKEKDGEGFSTLTLDTPFKEHLTEIVRQALESPIIRASMLLRTGSSESEALRLLEPIGRSKVVPKTMELLEIGGATLVHRNKTRQKLAVDIRQLLGYEEDTIEVNEPLLVLQNNYPLGMYNGEIVKFGSWTSQKYEQAIRDPYSNSAMTMNFGLAKIEERTCMLSPEEVSGKSEANKIGTWIIKKNSRSVYRGCISADERDFPPPYLSCNYGYALTVAKSQGSEFPETLIVCESSIYAVLSEIERKRLFYTAITRAKEKVFYCYA